MLILPYPHSTFGEVDPNCRKRKVAFRNTYASSIEAKDNHRFLKHAYIMRILSNNYSFTGEQRYSFNEGAGIEMGSGPS